MTARSTQPLPRVGTNLRWLIEQLWEREEQAGRIRVSVDGTVPAGYRPVERFAVVPELRRARFLVPLHSRRAAWASTARYNGLRPASVRLPRAVIGAGMRTGLAQRLPLDRLVVCVADGTDPDALPRLLLGAHLRELLGQEVAMGIGVGEGAPNRKPTLQLFTLDGQGLGYAKLGWNELTRHLVANEVRALRILADYPPRRLGVPRLIASGRWTGLELAVTAPLPAGVHRHRPPGRVPPLEVTREIAGIRGTRDLPLAASPYWARTRRLVAEAGSGDDRLGAALQRYQGHLEQRSGATVLTFGSWHGDWVPWNLAWQGGRLFAWDWEHSGEAAPLGFDLLHWHFQLAFVLERRSPSEGMARCLRQGVPELVKLGVAEPAARLTAAIYLLELALRHARMHALGGGWNPRLYPEILGVLRSWAR